jgi:iron(III) transport system ATP-binding protein
MQPLLELDQIHCHYGTTPVVQGLSLTLQPGSLGCLLGASGCGKTTVLRAIAGFEPLQKGRIRLKGVEVSSPERSLPPEQRGIGMVFQDYALFPHLNVADNIAFGLRGQGRQQQAVRVAELLQLVGMSDSGRRYPHELSGGQQQRIALARALAPCPALLLFDEPFSNLDTELRGRLAAEVRDILRSQGTAALFVTHDQHEAFILGERIGIMQEGRLVQWDTPFNLYHEPASPFVADFIGQGRFIAGQMLAPDQVQTALGVIQGNRAYPWPSGSPVRVLLRPDDVELAMESMPNALITACAFRGADTLYTLRLDDGSEILSLMPSRMEFVVGQRCTALLRVEHLVLFAG